jgi:serine/threonine-protein kinase
MLTIEGGDRKSADNAPEASRREPAESGRDGLRRGDTLAGRYELMRPAGKGGMGAVWMARDRVLDVAVAIKVIRRDARVSGAEARLLTEARAAARLGHPAVVRVLDFGKTEWGDPFLAMELLEGETLAALLAREKRLSPQRAVQILLPVIDGLAALHTKQIIHRDLKPDNIFLARDEASRVKPKIVDFGIAKLEQLGPHEAITHCGEVLGSPAYMSPEQARGLGGIDHRTDIWSLCVVLYELIVGTRPFHAKNYNAMLRTIIEKPAPKITDPEVCDENLWTIIETGLRKEKSERWGSMRELGESLALWLYQRGIKEDVCASNIRTAWLEAGLSGVKVDLPPSVRPIMALKAMGYAPKIIDATAMNAALAATELQGVYNPRPSSPGDGPTDRDAMEQMRRLLCSGSTTESEPRQELSPLEEPTSAPGEADPASDEKEAHAYSKTTDDGKRLVLEPPEAKSLGATTGRRPARQTLVAALTCLVAATVGAGIGLFGQRGGRGEALEGGPVGAAFAMEAATEAATQAATEAATKTATGPGAAANGETKPAAIEAPTAMGAAARAEKASSEIARDGSMGSAPVAPVEPRKSEAQGIDTNKAPPKGTKAPSTAPKKAPATPRKPAGDDFNFGF